VTSQVILAVRDNSHFALRVYEHTTTRSPEMGFWKGGWSTWIWRCRYVTELKDTCLIPCTPSARYQ